ncbi:MAG: hypothetical protein HY884_07510 [Deltaproteobacteria bacterium]|nr:hypothetical protein [Deltaproteobacteria bacterium]
MASSSTELKEIFNRSVPKKFQESIIECLFDIYPKAYDYCAAKYPQQVAHDLLPHERRAMLETKLPEIAKIHKLEAIHQLNKTRNSHHAVISAGGIILTASYADSPQSIVRYAEFRKDYAQTNQGHLFRKDISENNAPRYAILLHGDDGTNKNLPTFACVKFPIYDEQSENYSSYIGDGIDLFSKHPDIVEKLRPTITCDWFPSGQKLLEECIQDTAQPVLRDDLAKKEIQNK